MVNNVTQT